MKILHLSGDWEDVGGILSVIRNLQTASEPWGWQHAVWVHQSYVEARRPSLPYRFSRHVCADILNHWLMLARSALAFLELKSLLRGEPFDVIHAHTRGTLFVAYAAARVLNQPVLFTNHSYASRVKLYKSFTRSKNFHTVLLTPNMLRHYGLEESFPKVSVISDCCADRFFDETMVERRPFVSRQTLRLVGVGNIMRWKKWDLLARALRLLSETERLRVEFSLWGPRPSDADSIRYDHELRALVRSSGLERQMQFRGVSHAVETCLRDADWFVIPSTNEPCSVALIEAMALGLPVLVTASGGNVDIVRDGQTGLLFKPDDPVDLAAKLRLLLNGLGAAAGPVEIRESVRHRCASRVAESYRGLYEHLVAGGRKGRDG